MQTNLLSIEQSLLNKYEVRESMKLKDIHRLQTNLSNGQKRKFEQTLELSKVVVAATTYFQSKECKQLFASEGVSWTMEDFALKVFGWKNSYFCKVRKAGALENEVVEKFKLECERIEGEGKDSNRTLEGLLKYAKQGTIDSEGEGEGEGEGENSAAERIPTIFVMTYKTEQGNVSIKVDSNGLVKTTNSREEILAAINFLTNSLPTA